MTDPPSAVTAGPLMARPSRCAGIGQARKQSLSLTPTGRGHEQSLHKRPPTRASASSEQWQATAEIHRSKSIAFRGNVEAGRPDTWTVFGLSYEPRIRGFESRASDTRRLKSQLCHTGPRKAAPRFMSPGPTGGWGWSRGWGGKRGRQNRLPMDFYLGCGNVEDDLHPDSIIVLARLGKSENQRPAVLHRMKTGFEQLSCRADRGRCEIAVGVSCSAGGNRR
jgi:hypothetical protein